MDFFSLCCMSVCLFRPEATGLTNCGWLALAWMSAGELLFYFAESPLTFISLHLLPDGDSKWQGLLSLFLLCLSVFSLQPPLLHSVSSSFALFWSFLHLHYNPIPSFFSPPNLAADTWILNLTTIDTEKSKLNLVCWGTIKEETHVSQRHLSRDTSRCRGEDVHDGIVSL